MSKRDDDDHASLQRCRYAGLIQNGVLLKLVSPSTLLSLNAVGDA